MTSTVTIVVVVVVVIVIMRSSSSYFYSSLLPCLTCPCAIHLERDSRQPPPRITRTPFLIHIHYQPIRVPLITIGYIEPLIVGGQGQTIGTSHFYRERREVEEGWFIEGVVIIERGGANIAVVVIAKGENIS